MTLARTALRLAAINALRGQTIAEDRIYDSLIGSLDLADPNERKPVIVVLTENDAGDAQSPQNGGPPFWRHMDLQIECGVVACEREGLELKVGYPETDAQAEAMLDLLEYNVIHALMRQLGTQTDPDLDPFYVFRQICLEIEGYSSLRSADETTGVKIAARTYTLRCRVKDDVVGFNAAATGWDRFPEPLRIIAKALPATSPEAATLEALAASLFPVTAPALEGMDAVVDADPTGTQTTEQAPQINLRIDLPQL